LPFKVVPFSRRLDIGLSWWRLVFDRGSVHVISVVDKTTLEQVFIRALLFSCQYYSINDPHSSSSYEKNKRSKPRNFKHTLFRIWGSTVMPLEGEGTPKHRHISCGVLHIAHWKQ